MTTTAITASIDYNPFSHQDAVSVVGINKSTGTSVVDFGFGLLGEGYKGLMSSLGGPSVYTNLFTDLITGNASNTIQDAGKKSELGTTKN